MAVLLALLVTYVFFVYPLLSGESLGAGVSILFSLILIAGVIATAEHHAVRAGIVVMGLIALTSHWTNVLLGGRLDHMVASAAAGLFFALQAYVITKRVFREGAVTVYRILGAIAVYLLLGLLWAEAYLMVYLTSPHTFSFAAGAANGDPPIAEMLYFSFVTLTTVGFGDITAVHPFARSLVMMEALVGQLFPALLLARLVTQYQGRQKKS